MPEGGKVFFVGCGPGDPELITVKARRLIREADVVVYSGSLIPDEILRMCGAGSALHDASGLVREEIFDLLRGGAGEGRLVVRLHDGDPSVYGAIREQIDELARAGVGSEVVPGVTALLASAAALGTQLTLPGVTQTVILTRAESRTAVPPRERIPALAAHGATMAFYLSAHLLPRIAEQAVEGGYRESTPAAVVYRASWPDQKVVVGTLADIARRAREEGITRTAIVIIGDAVRPTRYERSRLYDKTFSHGYRKAGPAGGRGRSSPRPPASSGSPRTRPARRSSRS